MVNLMSISITMGVLRYNKFDYSFVNQIRLIEIILNFI